MKCASMTWALGLLLAAGLAPKPGGVAAPRIPAAGLPTAALAQVEPPVALPGSADTPSSGAGDENGAETGQGMGGADPDAAPPDGAAPPDAAAPYDQGAGANGGMTDPNAGVDRPQDDPEAQMPQTNMQPPADENDDGSSAEQQRQSSDSSDSDAADQDSPPPVDNDNN